MRSGSSKHIGVIGGGVSGLSCGILLLQNGYEVTLLARELTPDTTSDVAAAIWYPFRAWPQERVREWCRLSMDYFRRLISEEPDSGVYHVEFTEFLPEVSPDPWWHDLVDRFRHARSDELNDLYKDGYVFDVPFIDTPYYMPWLTGRFRQLGGTIQQKSISALPELEPFDLVINCSGLGARHLFGDDQVYPIRGQLFSARTSGSAKYLLDQSGALKLFYMFSRRDDVIIGGTAEDHIDTLEPLEEEAERILEKCRMLAPDLEILEIHRHIVGLRPGRHEVRLEIDTTSAPMPVIHNYGHGGAGITLSWGCADEVLRLVSSL